MYVINLTPHLSELSISLFSSLLRFLYCGEFQTEGGGGAAAAAATTAGDDPSSSAGAAVVQSHPQEGDLAILSRLAEEFGTPNPLDVDLQSLFSQG